MEQCLQRSVNSHQPNIHANKWESAAMCVHGTNGNSSTVFDCSICLDNVQDPVVTLCGHLFCWACIYKWIHVGRLTHNDPEQLPQCPVCKAEVSENNLIPLYSGAQSVKPSDAEAKSLDPVIPRRPAGSPCGTQALVAATALTGSRPTTQLHHPSYPHRVHPYGDYLGDYTASMPIGLAGTAMSHPGVSMFAEMIYAWIFGNTDIDFYAHRNSYHLAGFSNPRVRRRVMQVDRSLSRVCFFLFCSLIFCLLLF